MNYIEHNKATFKVKVDRYTQSTVKARLVNMLKNIAMTLVSFIDNGFALPSGTSKFPVDTANLHDATGVGVYSDGAVMHFIPTARATKPQRFGKDRNIYGSPLLSDAIAYGATKFSKGIWIVLFSSVPYAYLIDLKGSKANRGKDFFAELERTLLNEVIANLKPISA